MVAGQVGYISFVEAVILTTSSTVRSTGLTGSTKFSTHAWVCRKLSSRCLCKSSARARFSEFNPILSTVEYRWTKWPTSFQRTCTTYQFTTYSMHQCLSLTQQYVPGLCLSIVLDLMLYVSCSLLGVFLVYLERI